MKLRSIRALLMLLLGCPFASGAADPLAVRYPQGAFRTFLVLKDLSGRILADGEVVQLPQKRFVRLHLALRFRDGSIDDEVTEYSQDRVFRLLRDRHIQKGPSFPKPMDVVIEAGTGTVTSRSAGEGGKTKVEVQHLDIPAEVSNGVTDTIISNLDPRGPAARLAYVNAGPSSPRLVHLAVSPVGSDPIAVAGRRREAMRFAIHVELGGVAGVLAPLVGKQPEDLQVWVVEGEVPLIVAEQGQLYQGGPVWRIELASPTWPPAGEKRP